jgi:PHD/YefM family antitoxin component YafN of YafNO toxin-antitoxin module
MFRRWLSCPSSSQSNNNRPSTGSEKTPARVTDPRTSDAYVLIPAAEYEAVREALEDEQRQRAIRAVALRNAAGQLGEEP